jgi:hypothetical protein
LFALLIGLGVFTGLVDLTMNIEGAHVERRLSRPIYAGLHGCASCGIAAGAIGGSVLTAGPAPWLSPLIEMATLVSAAALVFAAVPDARDEEPEPIQSVPAGRAMFVRALVILGLVIGVSVACENAAMFWSTLMLQQEAPALAAISGLGAAFFAACQASMRFNADRLRARIRDRILMIVSLGLAAIGFLIVATDGGFTTVVIGFAVIGLGTGCVVPCGFALAASRPGISAGAGLSTASMFGSIARVPAPFVVGEVANHATLAHAFGIFAVLLALAVAALFTLTEVDA